MKNAVLMMSFDKEYAIACDDDNGMSHPILCPLSGQYYDNEPPFCLDTCAICHGRGVTRLKKE